MKRSPFLLPLTLPTTVVGVLSLVAVCWGVPTLAQVQVSEDAIRQARETCSRTAEAGGFTIERLNTLSIEPMTDATGQTDPTLARIRVVLDLTRADGPHRLTCPLTVPLTVAPQADSPMVAIAPVETTTPPQFPTAQTELAPTTATPATTPSPAANEVATNLPATPGAIAPLPDPNASPTNALVSNTPTTDIAENSTSLTEPETSSANSATPEISVVPNPASPATEPVESVPADPTLLDNGSDEGFEWWWLLPLFIGLPVLLWLLLKGQRWAKRLSLRQPMGAIAVQPLESSTQFNPASSAENSGLPLQIDTPFHSTGLEPQTPLQNGAGVGHAVSIGHAAVNGTVPGAGVGDRAIAQHNRALVDKAVVPQRGDAEQVVIPLVAEEMTLTKQQIPRQKVRVHKRVETREAVVATPILHQKAVVEHVPIHQYVTGDVPTMREENGVLIIPIVEEVTVVEKRLLLREEVRLVQQQTVEKRSQTVVLQREVVAVERLDLAENAPLQAELEEQKHGSLNGNNGNHASTYRNQNSIPEDSQNEMRVNDTQDQFDHHKINSTVASGILERKHFAVNQGDRSATNAAKASRLNTQTKTSEETTNPTVTAAITPPIQQNEQQKVQIHKQIQTQEKHVETPITHNRIAVEKIPLNQYITDAIPEVRKEGNTLIIPVIEEVTITEKRLLLREEVRIYKQHTTEDRSQKLTLRREFVEVERIPLDDL